MGLASLRKLGETHSKKIKIDFLRFNYVDLSVTPIKNYLITGAKKRICICGES
jgi:hypothetical protein